MKTVKITETVSVSNDSPMALISGPCQLENLDHARMLAEEIARAAEAARTPFIFKASFDKANRSSLAGKRGIGIEAGLTILSKIRAVFGCPVLTDVHTEAQCSIVAEAVDVLQIPAFLSRQTDLLLAAGETGAAINFKKGQFLAPWDMKNVTEKIASTGNTRLMLCERGASFGYNMLVSDLRSLPIMAETGYPVVFDATHSVQLPGGKGTSSDGESQFVLALARAAVAVGTAAVFIETHEDPTRSPSDGPNIVALADLSGALQALRRIDDIVKTPSNSLRDPGA